MTELVAGHEFDSLDRCKTCTRTWFQIMHVTRDQIGESGIAHYGPLNEPEYSSIVRKRDRERPHIWQVVLATAIGGSPAPVVIPMHDDANFDGYVG